MAEALVHDEDKGALKTQDDHPSDEPRRSFVDRDEEPLLKPNKDRFVLFPIKHHDIWEMYKQEEASFWTAEEIDLDQDKKDWNNLNDDERHFIEHVLAFFAASDGTWRMVKLSRGPERTIMSPLDTPASAALATGPLAPPTISRFASAMQCM